MEKLMRGKNSEFKYERLTTSMIIDSAQLLAARHEESLAAETQRQIDINIGLILVRTLRENGPMIVQLDSSVKDELDNVQLWKQRVYSNVAHTVRIKKLGEPRVTGDMIDAAPEILSSLKTLCEWVLKVVGAK